MTEQDQKNLIQTLANISTLLMQGDDREAMYKLGMLISELSHTIDRQNVRILLDQVQVDREKAFENAKNKEERICE